MFSGDEVALAMALLRIAVERQHEELSSWTNEPQAQAAAAALAAVPNDAPPLDGSVEELQGQRAAHGEYEVLARRVASTCCARHLRARRLR